MIVGQTVYLRPIRGSNADRMNKSIRESTIEKIGRKYFEVKNYGKFYISNLIEKTEYTPNYKIYLNKKELDLTIEREDLTSKLRSILPKYGSSQLPIDKLRKIISIINDEKY